MRISDWSSDVCSSDLLRRGEVPALAGRGLVVPDVVAGLGFQRHDRRQEQVVALAVAAHLAVPGRTVAGADVEQVERGIVGHRIPDRATAAQLPVLIAEPGFLRHRHGRVFRRLRRITRSEENTTELPSIIRISYA